MASSIEVAPYLAKRLSLIIAKHTVGDTTTAVNDGSSSKVVVTATPTAAGGKPLVFSMDLTEIPHKCCGIAAIIYITIVHSHMLRATSPQLDTKDSKKLQTMIKYFANVDPAIFEETGGVESEEEEEDEEEKEEKDDEEVDTQFSIIKKGTCKMEGSVAADPSFTEDGTNYEGASGRPAEESNGNEDGNGGNTPAGSNDNTINAHAGINATVKTGQSEDESNGNPIRTNGAENRVNATPNSNNGSTGSNTGQSAATTPPGPSIPTAKTNRNDPSNKIYTNTPPNNGAGNQSLVRATNINNGSTAKATPAPSAKKSMLNPFNWFSKTKPVDPR
jgi:hypothetical protein